jgi:hypothetical protein
MVNDVAPRLDDARLALLLGAALFVLAAWPLALVKVPPLQDLPNHLATATVLLHPDRYPEYAFNGFFKTNGALFAFLYVVGKRTGVEVAARLFVLLVLAVTAFTLPRFVLETTGSRARMVASTAFAWPFVHNWFVSMGMLDFALGVPLSCLVLVLLARQARAWSWGRAAGIALLALATWYAHVFALMVVHLLVGIHALTRASRSERRRALRLFVPLLPGTALVLVSLYEHATEPTGKMHGFVSHAMPLPTWEIAYNLWAEWLWGFTGLEISSFVVAVGLAFFALRRWREGPSFFGPCALFALAAFYVLLPHIATNWFHVSSRVLPYLWLAALVRVPERLDRRLVGLLGLSAALYSVGLGVDYLRLDADRAAFTAGIDAVPEGARLLPLLFRRQRTSENTRSLLHAWGFYVAAKQTAAPLLFAHSRSFPLRYREPPPPRFNHLVLETFAPDMRSPEWMCGTLRNGGIVVDCPAAYHEAWVEFWRDARPRYDWLLLWDASPEALAEVPEAYHVVVRREPLLILERSR